MNSSQGIAQGTIGPQIVNRYFVDDFDGKSDDSADSDFDYVNEELENVEDEGNPADLGLNTQSLGDINWTEVAMRTNRQKQWTDEFNVNSGPINCPLGPESSPLEYFYLIFTPSMLDDIIEWTNRRADLKIENTIRRRSHQLTWKKMSFIDIQGFIGALFVMGIVKFPSFKMFWDKQTRFFSVPGISDIFSFQRFMDIYTCLCFRDITQDNPENRLCKIQPLVTAIISNSQSIYLPEQNLSVDESMIGFKGRTSMKVYMPAKPIKYGLKAYVLCEARTGYVLNWSLHTGQMRESQNSITYNIVMSLVQGYEGENYIVFMDRFYSSIALYLNLREMSIGACGTIQSQRLHFDQQNKEIVKNMEDRKRINLKASDLLLSVWKDHNTVFMLSNYHRPTEVEKERKLRKKDLAKSQPGVFTETVILPQCVADYNVNMGGVDRLDQHLSYYSIQKKSRRWYIKVFFHLLEISFLNSYVIYSRVCAGKNKKPMTRLQFRQNLARELIREAREQKKIETTTAKKMGRQSMSETGSESKEEEKDNVQKSMVCKKLVFETGAKNVSAGKGLKLRSSVSEKKRKATSVMKKNEFVDCLLQDLPQDPTKKTRKKECMECQSRRKEAKGQGKISQTHYYCVVHNAPLCVVGCYDEHRKKYISLLQKKTRLSNSK